LPPCSLSADVPEVGVLERELVWLKEHLPPLDSPVVFCHNDLLCKNIIYDSSKGTVSGPGRQGCRGPVSSCRATLLRLALGKQRETVCCGSQVD